MKGISDPLILMLGSNLGDRKGRLEAAIAMIDKAIGKVVERSSVYETAPWGVTDQPAFLNVLIVVEPSVEPETAMKRALEIEQLLGRDRSGVAKGGARDIDIDLLFYGDRVVNTPLLTLPHPAIQDRNFVLVPLREMCPKFVHPVLEMSAGEMLNKCQDKLPVKKLKITLKNAKKVN